MGMGMIERFRQFAAAQVQVQVPLGPMCLPIRSNTHLSSNTITPLGQLSYPIPIRIQRFLRIISTCNSPFMIGSIIVVAVAVAVAAALGYINPMNYPMHLLRRICMLMLNRNARQR
jgi:hypothetical protein